MVQFLHGIIHNKASRQLLIVQVLKKQIHVRYIPNVERRWGDIWELQVRLGRVRLEPKMGEAIESIPTINTKDKEVDPEYVLQ